MNEPHYSDDNVTVHAGDCLDVLKTLADNSVDAVCTDPPYGLEFMGKDWDRPWAVSPTQSVGFAGRQLWCERWAAECLRVLKPGGHMLAFGGTRTWHRLACAVEDAGFEIRDSIAWLYGSGFPKSLDVSKAIDRAAGAEREQVAVAKGARNDDGYSGQGGGGAFGSAEDGTYALTAPATDAAKQWQGYGTALKPAFEPIVVARNIFKHSASGFTTMETYGDSGGASRFFPTFKYTAKAPGTERPTADGVAHPTVKPLDLIRWCIKLVTPPGGVVLDPFAGSGTTGEAAIHEHKRAILIEREPTYLPLIVARLSKPMEIGFDFEGTA